MLCIQATCCVKLTILKENPELFDFHPLKSLNTCLTVFCSLARVLKVPLCGRARIFRALFQEIFIKWWWMMEGVFSESLQWVTLLRFHHVSIFPIGLGYLAFCFPVFLCKSLIELGFSCCLRGEVCFAWENNRGMQKMMLVSAIFFRF